MLSMKNAKWKTNLVEKYLKSILYLLYGEVDLFVFKRI